MDATTIIREGHDAWRLLNDPGFCREWKALADADRKHTWYQEPHFCGAWYRAYRQTSQPLLLLAQKGSALSAIMPLARFECGGLTHAGADQCEYQGWIADTEYDQTFPLDCVRLLFERTSYHRWEWRYVAPDAPIDWLSEISSAKLGGIMTTNTLAPLFNVRDEGFIRRRVRGSLKNRINHLRRRGLNYERVKCPARSQEIITKLATWYDVRQGATRATMEFTSDPAKLDFYRQLASDPDQNWVSVLNLEHEAIAAHIGPRVGSELEINLPSYAVRESRDAPSTILLVEMAEDLSRHGGTTIDLTPGGDTHKERWATHHRNLYSFRLFRSRTAAAAMSSRSLIRRTTVSYLRKAGIEPRAVLNILKGRSATQHANDRNIAIREFRLGVSIDNHDNACRQAESRNNECVERMLLERARQLNHRAAHKLIAAAAQLWSEGWRPLVLGPMAEPPRIVWLQPIGGGPPRRAERLAALTGATKLGDASLAWTLDPTGASTMELTTSELNAIAAHCDPATSRLLAVSEQIT